MKLLQHQLARHFGISDIVPIRCCSWNYAFSGSGPAGRFFVKVIRPGPERRINGAVEFGARVARALADTGYGEVVPPLRNRDGELLTRSRGAEFLVYPWIDNTAEVERAAANRVPRIDHLAVLLAALHQSLRDLDEHCLCTQGASRHTSPFSYSSEEWSRSALQLWSAAERCAGISVELHMALSTARSLADRLSANDPLFFRSSPEDQILHGDFQPRNLLLAEGRLRVIDFDMCHRGNLAEDVAYAALTASGAPWLMGERDNALVLAFLNAYNEERQRVGAVEIRGSVLSTALVWSVLKAMSLSFKAEQIMGRQAALQSILRLVGSRSFLEL